ncbi:Uma2 family endonuclease [Pleurocapsa sp. PCC 7319]|uniref:Uma2 family endonuclease n=1 Tax=Pleurocapsa sp. PCC 7319 TaxID=118161 RepID=UPI000347FAF5|nr:Uma2 family endonuclease [Pleurocapsa sp. PCC 7319]
MQVTIPTGFKITEEQFDQIAAVEDVNKLELTATGELIVMSPTGGETGDKNSELNGQLWLWNKQTGLGKCFDSSTLFILPSRARRSPDVSWILNDRWNQLTLEEKRQFPPIAPDFVIELVSPSDNTKARYQKLQDKMHEYIDNGVRLGWLINPETKVVEIYRINQPVEIIENPATLDGEDVLVGFVLNLNNII